MQTETEKTIKRLGLDYDVLSEDIAFKIRPLDFLTRINIIIVQMSAREMSMFIYDTIEDKVKKEVFFKYPGEIAHYYSFLYNFDKNNLKDKDVEQSI